MGEGALSRRSVGREDTGLARFIMELRSKGMTDARLLNAFEATPRAAFLPNARSGLLYDPIALPIPCGEQATDPFQLAQHLLLLEIRPGMSVLEIGTGSGFFTGVLARFGANVTSLERYASLLSAAGQALANLGIDGPNLVQADGLARQPGAEMFDRIIVNGAMPLVPAHLVERLLPNGLMLGYRQRESQSHLTI